MHDVRIGISGWTYKPWRGTFYPKGHPQKKELDFAARQLRSIEINGSFYSLQRPNSWQAWRDATPDDFVFSVKAGRFITHMRRLKNAESAVANFWASGLLALGPKLGPILWQLPPNFSFDADVIDAFCTSLPRDMNAAAKLARKHDAWMKGRTFTRVETNHRLRHAMEVRHESFNDPAFLKLMKKHNVAAVVADTAGKWPMFDEATADFVYVRLHGTEQIYVSGYTDEALDRWAKKIKAWRRRRDVYVYFDNDVKVRAPFDAMSLASRLGVAAPAMGEFEGEVTEEARKSWPAVHRRSRK